METIELSLEDRGSLRWLEVGRSPKRVQIRAGRVRQRPGMTSRRVRTTVWEIGRTPAGPAVVLLEPMRRSATTHFGGMVADVSGLIELCGDDESSGRDLQHVTDLTAEVLGCACGRTARSHGLLGVLTGSTYPLLDQAMEQGAVPPTTVPPIVAPYLRAESARAAAQRAFGRRANRPVVRALAASLRAVDGEAPALEPLAAAVIGTSVLPSERLVDLLGLRPALPGAVTMAAREVASAQELLGRLHPAVAFRLLVESLESPTGPALLVEALGRWDVVGRPDPPARVRTLRVLRDTFADLPLELDRPVARPRPAGAVRAAGRDRPGRIAPQQSTPGADPYPSDIRALHGTTLGPFVIDVPANGAAMPRWGVAMDNCLGGFRRAVDVGLSHIVGYRRNGDLHYAVEISRERWLRQIEGRRAAMPNRTDEALIVGHLRRSGVLDPAALRRRPGRQLAAPI